MLTLLLLFAQPEGDGEALLKLSKADLGKAPAGWTAAHNGDGERGEWKVVEAKEAPGGLAVEQQYAGPNRRFNLLLLEGSRFKDGELSVRLKAGAGKHDQGGGLLWRAVDQNNYWVARWNPLEKNIRLYTVTNGVRKQLASKEEVDGGAADWHTLTIRHRGPEVVCLFDGTEALRHRADEFPDPGMLGLWTKADAATRFAELRLKVK